jgi:hypothetical protein
MNKQAPRVAPKRGIEVCIDTDEAAACVEALRAAGFEQASITRFDRRGRLVRC